MMMIPIVMTLVGIVTDVSDLHDSNALWPILVTLLGIVILVIGHAKYWKLLILVVPAGMVTDVDTVSVYRFIPVTV